MFLLLDWGNFMKEFVIKELRFKLPEDFDDEKEVDISKILEMITYYSLLKEKENAFIQSENEQCNLKKLYQSDSNLKCYIKEYYINEMGDI